MSKFYSSCRMLATLCVAAAFAATLLGAPVIAADQVASNQAAAKTVVHANQ